ncbi:AbrB/MazE/SpoVT family DNA-binding domain-containing protein [Halomicrobium sp. LC1Hm]|uniref:AbrB/MazE/SpoVT family DNA-binding domain-containing protein n=1 Tax=Halomicrobium sp. LC1Hm TaxID=2610902 RepID=UPI00129840F6|nr:AbrB/MazE/SpoVT family DNA-binding domain-containing protein [Halomicrobium sp. LC1Hm]
MYVDADDGRIYLPKDVRDRFGARFELVERGDKLVLIPVADDPLAALRAEFATTEASSSELADQVLDEALDEAGR